MPRKRYLKPGFFKNEDLAELEPIDRLFFQGLWCWADREGRLEDRPKRLKGDILPYDNYDAEKGLQKLAERGFIKRYTTNIQGKPFKAIQIITFKSHQDVHKNEQSSTIPGAGSSDLNDTIVRDLHGVSTVQAPAKDSATTEVAPDITVACTPCNLELVTSNLELGIDDDVDNAQARKIHFAAAVEDYFNPDPAYLPEKEKSSAQKEKVLPAVEDVIAKVAETAHWRNVLEHYRVAHNISPEQREELFRVFYEQKEDHYRIRFPTITEIASHFYNWVPIHLNKNNLQKLTSNAAKQKHTGSPRQSTSDKQAELRELNAQSRDFLHKSSAYIHQG